MTQRQREYIQKEFKQYLTATEETREYYTIPSDEPFELIKIYKHLLPYFKKNMLSTLYINPSEKPNLHYLFFSLDI